MRVSATQWRDIIQILRLSADGLEMPYIQGWAKDLELEALLARAVLESR